MYIVYLAALRKRLATTVHPGNWMRESHIWTGKRREKKLSNIIFYERSFQQQFIVLFEMQLLFLLLSSSLLQFVRVLFVVVYLQKNPFFFDTPYLLMSVSILVAVRAVEMIRRLKRWFLWCFLFNVTTASTNRDSHPNINLRRSLSLILLAHSLALAVGFNQRTPQLGRTAYIHL